MYKFTANRIDPRVRGNKLARIGLILHNGKTMINECVGAMSLAIHEGMDSRGFHLETGKAP
jgi:hypothetical protein